LNENGVVDEDENFYLEKQDMINAIATGKYPSPPARDLYIVTKDGFSETSKDFILWILADGQKYVTETGYIPLKEDILQEQIAEIG